MIDGQKKYGFNVNTGLNEETCKKVGRADYCVAVVNPGESFYYNAGKWTDWTEVIPVIKASESGGEMFAIDNFSIKAYMVSTSDPMYRLYNPNTGEHFYTSNAGEKDYLSAIGWNYEGIGWNAPVNSDTPVYRLFNPFTSEHYYTLYEFEKDILVGLGWDDEGIEWYSADNGMPIYRVFNPYEDGPAAHYFTANAGEREILVGLGYIDEGIGWYGL